MTTKILIILQVISMHVVFSQTIYKDSMFAVQKEEHIFYGQATNFAGGMDSLFLDMYTPIGNRIPCRPTMVFIHGGAFIAGNSNDLFEALMANYFASTGYTTISINYRLNNFKRSFYTPYALCNDVVSPPGFSKCVYVADTAEVIRALFRAQQDTKGALRFLVKNAVIDSINVDDIFIGGTSAGAITALASAFYNKASEKSISANAIADAPTPDPYLTSCLPASYSLARPDLGDINGNQNLLFQLPQIRGVAAFYGAVLDYGIFDTIDAPYLYLYHRTQDPIVDSGTRKAISGLYDYCYNPTSLCQPLDNWPYLHGNFAISNYLTQISYPSAKLRTKIVANAGYCDGQGHSIDNWKLRSDEVMDFFYDEVLKNSSSCGNIGLSNLLENNLSIFPNPFKKELAIYLRSKELYITTIQLISFDGQLVYAKNISQKDPNMIVLDNLDNFSKGSYVLNCSLTNGQQIRTKVLRQ